MWIDSHCHLDAPEFDADRAAVVDRAKAAGVAQIVLPAVSSADWATVRALAHEHGLVYALGIHPLCVADADEAGDLRALAGLLAEHRDDPRLVAIGEIGIDHFVPGLDLERQARFFVAQLKLAREFGLPVIVHTRRSVDTVLKHLRAVPVAGIAHAFNGSAQQAQVFVELGFKLGFGGAMTFDRALQIRRLAVELPIEAIVLETDAPDIPPHWLYRTQAERAAGALASRNEPAELPRIAAALAELRGIPVEALAEATGANVRAVLPRLA